MKKTTEKNIYHDSIVERQKRRPVLFPAQLLFDNNTYSGFVTNISSQGLGVFIKINVENDVPDCTTDTKVKVIIQSPLGDDYTVLCKVRWSRIYHDDQDGTVTRVGLELIDPNVSIDIHVP